MRAVLALAVLAACYAPPDYRNTHFACKQSRACPEGLMCSEDHCVPPSEDELLIDQVFVITRDEVPAPDCSALGMRVPTEAERRAAERAGVHDGPRCVRSVP